jgi:hypothetical protein
MKVSARFEKIEEIQRLFSQWSGGIVGIGVTAFPRVGLGYLLPNYTILCLLESLDLAAIRQLCPVVSLEKDLKVALPEKFNTSGILSTKEARAWLRDKSALFVYKASVVTDRLAKELNLRLLSTPGKIRKVFENKQFFREELKKAGIEPIPGENLLIDDLTEKRWQRLKKDWGERLVFQLTDYTIGGGLGTFFIESKEDFLQFWDFVKRRREVRELGRVNVCQRIKGKQASISGCATHHGVVTGSLQTQIIDQPELAALVGRSGVWLGHDWNIRFTEAEQLGAEQLCRRWGEYLYQQGYKGIFGLDLVVDQQGKVWPVECNSRYTGAFPVYTMIELAQNEMPLDVWHLLEWLEIDYEMEIKAVQQVAREPKKGGQLLLHNLERKWVTPTKTVKAGVYRDQEWLRPGFSLLDIKDEAEYVLCDRLVGESNVLKPAERIGRLLFKRRLIDDQGRLLPEIQTLVKQIYAQFALMPIENPITFE